MVIFVDLDDESEPPEELRLRGHWDVRDVVGRYGAGRVVKEKEVDEGQRENPNRTAFTEALGCYP